MNKNKQSKTGSANGAALARSGAWAFVLAMGMVGMSVPAVSHAQSTSGSIRGHAPAGNTVVAEGRSGMHRQTKVRDNGRFRLRALRSGVYTVTLLDDDKEVARRYGIQLAPGGSFVVDFDCKDDDCSKRSKRSKPKAG